MVMTPLPAGAGHAPAGRHTGTGPAGEHETNLRVAAKERAADGVVIVTLREAEGRRLPGWAPGAHVDLLLDHAPARQYSLCGDPADRTTWRLGVLREPEGTGSSRYIHDRLEAGDTVRARGPRNNFALVPAPRYLFIAGGIGITPILPMIAAADGAAAGWRLAYGGRSRTSMAFLDVLAGYGEHVTVYPQDETGLLDLPELLSHPRDDTLVYCCGPEPLLAAVEHQCARWPEDALHVERFTARPLPEPVGSEPFDVELNQSGLTLTIPSGRSILEVVEEAGVGVLTSCEEGTCGTCETTVLDGIPDHRDSVLTPKERAANDCMMICVSRSRTPRLKLDL